MNSLVHFEIPVDDVEKVKKFYSDAFGWKFQKAPMPDMEYWLINTGPQGKSIGGGMYKREEATDRVKLYVGDQSLETAIQRFKSAGGTIIQEFDIPGQVKGAVGLDPEKNVVGIVKNQSSSASRRSASRSSKKSSRTAKKKSER